ncbi:hypothetical protein [Leifsonia shinshuensis]
MTDIATWWNEWVFLPALAVAAVCILLANRFGRRWFHAGLWIFVPVLTGSLVANFLSAHTVLSWVGTAAFACAWVVMIVVVIRYVRRLRRPAVDARAED